MRILILSILTFNLTLAFGGQFTVINNNDAGAGSLRQALIDANALAGSDEITFIDGLGDIVLTSGEIVITDEVSISGPESGQVVSGNEMNRIFAVTNSNSPLALSNLLIKEGGRAVITEPSNLEYCELNSAYGFGICTEGDLSLSSVSVDMNGYLQLFEISNDVYGVGIFVGGSLISENSVISNNFIETLGEASGAGIYVKGDAHLTNTQISNNSCSAFGYCSGGGVYVENGHLEIINSTIKNNNAEAYKEKFNDESSYGAAYVENGGLMMVNSTITGNSAFRNPGIRVGDGDAKVYNSTIANNGLSYFLTVGSGYGLSVNGELEMHSSSVTGTSGFDIEEVFYRDCFALTLNPSSSHNFIGSDDESDRFNSCGIENGVNNNTVGAGLSPFLEPASSDNGCEFPAGSPGNSFCVETMAPSAGSPLIDGGSNPLDLVYDQRGPGFSRALTGIERQGALVDIGAYEQTGLPFNGRCFQPRPEPSHMPPEDNLCALGTATEPFFDNNKWNWTCQGQFGGNSQECRIFAVSEELELSSENGSINCSPNPIFVSQNVTCEAVPDPGFEFDSWSGACLGSDPNQSCDFVYDGSNLQIGAVFVRGSGSSNPIAIPTFSQYMKLSLILMMLMVVVIKSSNKRLN